MNARNAHLIVLGCVVAVVSACSSIPMAPPQPTLEGVERLRNSPMMPLALGEFRLAPNASPALDQPMSVRTNSVYPESGGTYSQYLRETFKLELIAAGKFDEKSSRVVTAQLTDNRVDGSVGSTNEAHVGARISVNSGGRVVLEKQYDVSSSWESTFLGAVAIPRAVNEYSTLFRKLVDAVIADREFQAVTSSN